MMLFQFIGIQIFSLMYLALILIVYSSKKRFESVENSIFKVLLIFTIIELGVDIGINYTIKYAELVPLLNAFLCRFSLFGYHIWAALLMLYVLLIGNKEGYKTIKELYQKSFKVQIGTIIVFLLGFLVFLLPMGYLYDKTYRISYIVGTSSLYTYAITILYLIVILWAVVFNKNKIQFIKRIPIFVFVVTASIFLPIQKFNADVPVLIVPLMSFAIMIMYFTLENPDVKLINELNDLKLEAEEVGKIKSKFLDNVSYNMKSPMNAIMGYSQTILRENLTENAKKDIENINIASRNLLEMVDNTLDVSKIESNICVVNNEQYNLKDLLNNVCSLVSSTINNPKVKFIVEVKNDIPCNLLGDYIKLDRVLKNILSNSIKYTNVGRIKLSVDGNVIDNKVNLVFKIKDTGIGIKGEEQKILFEKFSRMEKNNEGTGIGLYLSKKLIELLGGNISLESTYGAGSTFTINIKQTIVNNEAIGNFEYSGEEFVLNIFDARKKNIIVIDNDDNSLNLFKRMTGLYNGNVICNSNVEETLSLFNKKNKFDILFIEDKLANEAVFKVIDMYKSICNKDLKVIALSSDSLNISNGYFISKGYNDYMLKPIDLYKVDELLNKYLKKD